MAGAEDMADRAFLRLGHRTENQAILFLYVPLRALTSEEFTNSEPQ